MSDATAFLAAIRAAPDDDAPRLVYADWLDEHGQPERAEFIRVQCELARRESIELRQREAELLAEHQNSIAGPLAAAGLTFRFVRGVAVGLEHTGFFFSDDRGTRSRGTTILKLHQDGRADFDIVTEPPEAFVVRFTGRWMWAYTGGVYLLDTTSYPAAIKIECDLPEGSISYRGTLDRSTLVLKGRSGLTNRSFRQRFIHAHLPTQAAISESPQDAV